MVTYSVLFKDFNFFIWMGPITMVTLQKINKNVEFPELNRISIAETNTE